MKGRTLNLVTLMVVFSLPLTLGLGNVSHIIPRVPWAEHGVTIHTAQVDDSDPQLHRGQPPLFFVPNAGQADPNVRFQVHSLGGTVFFTPDSIVLSLPHPTDGPRGIGRTEWSNVVRMDLLGANPTPQIKGVRRLSGGVNYFIGNDPEDWHTDLPTFAGIIYHDLYPGIDLRYDGKDGVLKSTYVLVPGADPEDIRLGFEGLEKLEVDDQGDLILHVPGGEIRQAKPTIYQEIDGARQTVAGEYALYGKHQAGFRVTEYDPAYALVIDPELAYATFLGGNFEDGAADIAVDGSGNIYVTGDTYSSNFPTANSARQPGGRRDAFVTKLSPDGQSLVYSTYFGGGKAEHGTGIALGENGKVYVAGYTSSSDFPTVSPTQGSFGGAIDGFLIGLNPSGSALDFSSYIGGSDADYGQGVAACGVGTACVVGYTSSSDFPTASPEQPNLGAGGYDGFVSKINTSSSSVSYATYLGGAGEDRAYGVAGDGVGNAYVVGYTSSPDFPTTGGAFLPSIAGSADGFVTKFDSTGSVHAYSTYLGGSDDIVGNSEAAYDVAVDSFGHAYVVGSTQSAYFPTTAGAYDPTPNHSGDWWEVDDAFVSKLKPDGSGLIFSTMLGGTGLDWGKAIAVDQNENVYVAGDTQSPDFPTKRAFQSAHGGGANDVFVVQLNAMGSDLIYASYLGGNADDWMGWAGGIAVDDERNTFVAGYTESTDFPTVNPFQASHGDSGSYWDGFIVKVGAAPESVSTVVTPAQGGQLASMDGNTTFIIPSEAFAEPTRLTYTSSQTVKDTGALAGAGYSFDLTAVVSDTGETAQLIPGATYTTIITYTTIGPAIEDTLALYWWDGSQWVKESSSVVDSAADSITAHPDHLSLWAVLGETNRLFLPVVLRNR